MHPASHRKLSILVLIAIGLLFTGCQRRTDSSITELPYSFDGVSASLKETAIVPTLDRALPAGGSVLWCLAFDMACARLQADIFHGEPVRLEGGKESVLPVLAHELPVFCLSRIWKNASFGLA
jgi:hypothetical protein